MDPFQFTFCSQDNFAICVIVGIVIALTQMALQRNDHGGVLKHGGRNVGSRLTGDGAVGHNTGNITAEIIGMETVLNDETVLVVGYGTAFRLHNTVDQIVDQLAPVGHNEALFSQSFIIACNTGIGMIGLVVAVNRSVTQENKLYIGIFRTEKVDYHGNVLCNRCLGAGADTRLNYNIIKIPVGKILLVVDAVAVTAGSTAVAKNAGKTVAAEGPVRDGNIAAHVLTEKGEQTPVVISGMLRGLLVVNLCDHIAHIGMGIADENDLFAVQRTGLEHLGWFRNYGVNSFLGDGCSCRAIRIFCVCERIAVVATGIQTKQYGQE